MIHQQKEQMSITSVISSPRTIELVFRRKMFHIKKEGEGIMHR